MEHPTFAPSRVFHPKPPIFQDTGPSPDMRKAARAISAAIAGMPYVKFGVDRITGRVSNFSGIECVAYFGMAVVCYLLMRFLWGQIRFTVVIESDALILTTNLGPGSRIPIQGIESFVEKKGGVQITIAKGIRPWYARTHLIPTSKPAELYRAISMAKTHIGK